MKFSFSSAGFIFAVAGIGLALPRAGGAEFVRLNDFISDPSSVVFSQVELVSRDGRYLYGYYHRDSDEFQNPMHRHYVRWDRDDGFAVQEYPPLPLDCAFDIVYEVRLVGARDDGTLYFSELSFLDLIEGPPCVTNIVWTPGSGYSEIALTGYAAHYVDETDTLISLDMYYNRFVDMEFYFDYYQYDANLNSSRLFDWVGIVEVARNGRYIVGRKVVCCGIPEPCVSGGSDCAGFNGAVSFGIDRAKPIYHHVPDTAGFEHSSVVSVSNDGLFFTGRVDRDNELLANGRSFALSGAGGDTYSAVVAEDGRHVLSTERLGPNQHYSRIWTADQGWRSILAVFADEGIDLTGWTTVLSRGIEVESRQLVGSGINPDGETEAWFVSLSNDALSPNPGVLLASDSATGELRAYDHATGALLRTFTGFSPAATASDPEIVAYPNGVSHDLPNQALLADVFGGRVLRIDLQTGSLLNEYSGGGLAAPVDVAFADGNRNASAYSQDTVLISSFATSNVKEYDLETGAFLRDVFPPSPGNGAGVNPVDGAAGLARSRAGLGNEYYICSQRTDEIYRFDLTDNTTPVLVSGPTCLLDGPADILPLPVADESILISSFHTDEVIKMSRDGVCAPCIAAGTAGLDGPEGLTFTGGSTFAVTSKNNGKILEFDFETCSFVREITTEIGTPTYISYGRVQLPDCDGNGSADAWDIAEGRAEDANGDGVPDWCVAASQLGDMNCDGALTVSDIGPFVLALTNPSGYGAQYPDCQIANGDINGDGAVTVSDIGGIVALLTQ